MVCTINSLVMSKWRTELILAQSKDSSATYLHMQHPELADFLEDFTRPYNSQQQQSDPHSYVHHVGATATNGQTSVNVTYGASGTAQTVSSFLPIEDIYLPPQYQPANPEDEDDVVPDQHAAFGIARAMDRSRDAIWRDLGLEGLFRGTSFGMGPVRGRGGGLIGQGHGSGVGGSSGGVAPTLRHERSQEKVTRDVALRVKDAGRLMGGRRNICLR